jgi:1,4-alpha-glucan branching enzyme
MPDTFSPMKARGQLAIVLHTHMPYIEGFGTWPFGEEWLWEAIATSYLPLLEVLGRGPVTLSLTPVLCDQLEAPGAIERCLRFLREVRPESHRLDAAAFRESGEEGLAVEIERSALEYATAADRLAELGSGLIGALGAHASWTSSATHAVLPLIASDTGVATQVQTGIASQRDRFGEWGGGFWLPECAHAPWLHPLLEEAGVRVTSVELTNVFGVGDPRHLAPLATDDGPVLWPIDRQIMDLVWSEGGYPASGWYRDYHALTPHHHRVWCNEGSAYQPARASGLARQHAADFVGRVRERVREGGVCVCALDTELLGHWWYEGVQWLGAVLEESARQGLELTTVDDAVELHQPVPAPQDLGVSSWGEGGDLRTWSAPRVADFAWLARSAELELLAAASRPPDRAVRELLALQSSDWAFLTYRNLAGEYARQRALGHAEAMAVALASAGELESALRNLAPVLSGWMQ